MDLWQFNVCSKFHIFTKMSGKFWHFQPVRGLSISFPPALVQYENIQGAVMVSQMACFSVLYNNLMILICSLLLLPEKSILWYFHALFSILNVNKTTFDFFSLSFQLLRAFHTICFPKYLFFTFSQEAIYILKILGIFV